MKLNGKTIVITGASSGIGKALKEYFSTDNTVISLSRSATVPDIACDLNSDISICAAAKQIIERYGKVDVLINNAGYGLYGAAELLGDEQIERQFATNVTGAILLTKKLLPVMREGSKIINVASACALFPLPFRTMYCSSKAALNMYSFGLKMELQPYNIDVTSICPGDVKTPFTVNREKNYSTNERYGNRIDAADKKITSRENKRMPMSYAVKKMIKIIEKKRYKPMYIVGGKYKLLYFLYRITPHSLFFAATRKIFS